MNTVNTLDRASLGQIALDASERVPCEVVFSWPFLLVFACLAVAMAQLAKPYPYFRWRGSNQPKLTFGLFGLLVLGFVPMYWCAFETARFAALILPISEPAEAVLVDDYQEKQRSNPTLNSFFELRFPPDQRRFKLQVDTAIYYRHRSGKPLMVRRLRGFPDIFDIEGNSQPAKRFFALFGLIALFGVLVEPLCVTAGHFVPRLGLNQQKVDNHAESQEGRLADPVAHSDDVSP